MSRAVDFIIDWNDMTFLQSFTTPIKINKPYKTIGKTGYIMEIVITDFEDDYIFDWEEKGEENV